MFANLFVSCVEFTQYDIIVRHYTPTALGRAMGYVEKWTVAQFDGKWGAWYINGEHTGSQEIEVGNDTIRAINHYGYLWMDYSCDNEGNLVQSLNNGEYGVFNSLSLLKKDGTTEEILEALPA